MTENTTSSKLARGARRAAPANTAATAGGNGAATAMTFGGRAASRPIVLPDGEVAVTIDSVRALTSKAGALTISVNAIDDESGRPIRLRNLLVYSPGGASDLVDDNTAVLETLAGLGDDDEVSIAGLIERLTGARAGFQVVTDAHYRSKRPENVLVDAWLIDDAEA